MYIARLVHVIPFLAPQAYAGNNNELILRWPCTLQGVRRRLENAVRASGLPIMSMWLFWSAEVKALTEALQSARREAERSNLRLRVTEEFQEELATVTEELHLHGSRQRSTPQA